MLHRTYLFAPGNHARKVEKALETDADAAILDLEDAVAIAEKRATREVVVAALKRPRHCRAYVRVNSADTQYCYGDLRAVVTEGLDGVVLPKVQTAAQLATIDWLLYQLEREAGLAAGSVDLLPIIETGLGLRNVDAICRAGTRVRRLSFGAGDFALDLNIDWTADEHALADARSRIVLASRAAELEPPLDTVVIQVRDHERCIASAQRARELGFQGKLCIHPDQVQLCNDVFTPSEQEVAHARRVVSAFEQAEEQGSASIQLDGYFIDYPIVYRAKRVLAMIEELEQSVR